MVPKTTRRILGLCNGQLHGNSEILLKAALAEAQSVDETIEISWIHTPSVDIPRNPTPLKGMLDISAGTNKGHMAGAGARVATNGDASAPVIDDRRAVLDAILDADAIIVATATYCHQPPGFLKAIMDRIGGPFLDVAFVTTALEKKAAGDPRFANFQYDPRLLKPRVLGFMAVGGSTTADQFAMSLPTMHMYFYCIHAKIVDQFVAMNFMDAGSVLTDPKTLEKAKVLGRNVLSQIGKTYDEAVYLGPREEGACPNCYLAKMELLDFAKNAVGCVTCGTRGTLTVSEDGRILPEWEADSEYSCLTLRGKAKHCEDILSWGQREQHKLAGVQEEKESWIKMQISKVDLPSQQNATQTMAIRSK